LCDNAFEVVGRVMIDLTSGNVTQPAIPKEARGLMISWVPDNNGNAAGGVTIYQGEQGSTPWAVLLAPLLPAIPMRLHNGPISRMTERGSYFTIVASTGLPTGILILEFVNVPLPRYNV
jgi:hypothetical protein